MKKMNCYRNLLLVLCMLTVIVSCKDDEDSKHISRDLTMGIMSEYNYPIGPILKDWKVEIDDPDMIDVSMDENGFTITPKELGTTKLQVFDVNKKELFRMKVKIIVTERDYRIDRLSATVEIKDESYKSLIEKEIESLYPHGAGTVYELTYYTKKEGRLYVTLAEGYEFFEGTFAETENDNIVFHYNGSEHRYVSKIVADESKPDEDVQHLRYFIKDFTSYFKDKYPEAGVYRVNVEQITTLTNYWWSPN